MHGLLRMGVKPGKSGIGAKSKKRRAYPRFLVARQNPLQLADGIVLVEPLYPEYLLPLASTLVARSSNGSRWQVSCPASHTCVSLDSLTVRHFFIGKREDSSHTPWTTTLDLNQSPVRHPMKPTQSPGPGHLEVRPRRPRCGNKTGGRSICSGTRHTTIP